MSDEEKILIIMGNGPSLKGVNFESLKQYDTFGMNSAYKMYDKLNFYPTYFGSFDDVVCKFHKEKFEDLVKNSPIKKFFFLDPKLFSKDVQEHEKFQKINFSNLGYYNTMNVEDMSFENFKNIGCSGTSSTCAGIILGYTKIILIGCDANYVEKIKESKFINGKLVITETPKNNPNYWFDDYQEKGDEYNIPNANIWHVPAWNKLSKIVKGKGIEIVNCSSISKIKSFRISTLEKELPLYKKINEDKDEYIFCKHLDSRKNDIIRHNNKTIQKMKELCSQNKDAVAFNTHGWLKSIINTNLNILAYASSPEDGIYIKKSYYEKYEKSKQNVEESPRNIPENNQEEYLQIYM